ncbi:baseplate J/gp47 family protein [Streptomyces sp. NPDC058326]|uniref:baseplate J/gp47 family protein n=1 Tax=Streptomyces sp. NPDC058326 TaxID=3346447 RepID=UPI0036F028F5
MSGDPTGTGPGSRSASGPGPHHVSQGDQIAAMARSAAAARPVPHLRGPEETAPPWAELLFTPEGSPGTGPRTPELRHPDDPSQALLMAVAALHEGLARHSADLPGRARLSWLADRLGIPRRPMEPDEVVAVFTAPPAPAPAPGEAARPVVLPIGTELRGGRTDDGGERTYTTTDPLTLHGTGVLGVTGTLATPDGDRTAVRPASGTPFAPFAGTAAVHQADFASEVLAFDGGTATVTVTFPGRDATALEGVDWHWSTPRGLSTVLSGAPVYAGESVTLVLTEACGPLPGDASPLPFLRASFSGDTPLPRAFAFEMGEVRLRMERADVRPEAGGTGSGTVDITREFQPFGPAPRRGDSFYLRSDECFGKPLESLTLTFELLGDSGQGLHAVDYASPVQRWVLEELNAKGIDLFGKLTYDAADPGIQWQRRTGGGWQTFSSAGSTLHGSRTAAVDTGTGPLSEPAEVAGTTGNYVRLFLSSGDFGWENYLHRVARFAEQVAASPAKAKAADLLAPTPPTASRVMLGYRTREVTVRDVRTHNGHAVRQLALPTPQHPFEQPLDTTAGAHGTVALGLTGLAPGAAGALSLHVRVTQAPACGSTGHPHQASWEYWSQAQAWQPLTVLDGTRGLRQSGVLRVRIPADWAQGCAAQGTQEGRWLRLRTTTPRSVGEILDVRTDAVTAVYRGRPGGGRDRTPERPLAPGELKGLLRPLPGVKAGNPAAGTPGRAAEDDEAYLRRATGLVRHRGRAVQAWDYERIVRDSFPEVAAVRCLPHTGTDCRAEPGSVALVVVPHGRERLPYPGVTLAERILARLKPVRSPHARPVVLCPRYAEVRVHARLALAPGVAAAEALETLTAALEDRLHPTGRGPADFGRALYPSALTVLFEERPEVDHVQLLRLLPPHDTVARVAPDPHRGLIASAGGHELVLEEQL